MNLELEENQTVGDMIPHPLDTYTIYIVLNFYLALLSSMNKVSCLFLKDVVWYVRRRSFLFQWKVAQNLSLFVAGSCVL